VTAGASSRMARDRLGGEDGSTMLLAIFYCVLGLAIILVVASATTLYLERKRLFSVADGAALAAAEAWELDQVTLEGDALMLALDSAAVHDAAARYLSESPTELAGVQLVRAASDDGRSATVTLRSVWQAPLHTELVPLEVPIEVTVTARSVFH
jgi:uncharacterized membrane protein